MPLTILDHISTPGAVGGRNEDRIGWSASAAFVIDGATSLSDAPRLGCDGETDPEWLADMAAGHFAAALDADSDGRAVIRAVCANAAEAWSAAGGDAAPRWARPTAGAQLLIDRGASVETIGLGDCKLYVWDAAGVIAEHSGLPPQKASVAEQAAARRALQAAGGLGPDGSILQRLPEAVERMRASRGAHNSEESGVWTLGVVAEAADRAVSARWSPSRPALALLCSDGIADLVDLYAAYDAIGLVRAAKRDGLAALLAEIRRLEREVDPEGRRYPRFKRSDDASAVLARLD